MELTKIEKLKKQVEKVVKYFNRESIYAQLKSSMRFLLPNKKNIEFKLLIGGGSYTDGKQIVIGLPEYMIEKTFKEIFSALKAITGHESEHVRSSDFEVLKAYLEEVSEYLYITYGINKDLGAKIGHYIANSIEDGRIEKRLVNRMKGYLKHIKYFRGMWWVNQPVDGKDEYNDFVFAICTVATTGLFPKDWELYYTNEIAEENIEKIRPLIIKGINASTAKGCCDYCMEIIRQMGDYIAELLKNENMMMNLIKQLIQQDYDTSEVEQSQDQKQDQNNNSSGKVISVHFKPEQKEDSEEKEDNKDQNQEQSNGQPQQGQGNGDGEESEEESEGSSGSSSSKKKSKKNEKQKDSKEKDSTDQNSDNSKSENDDKSTSKDEDKLKPKDDKSTSKDDKNSQGNGSGEDEKEKADKDDNKSGEGSGSKDDKENDKEDNNSKSDSKSKYDKEDKEKSTESKDKKDDKDDKKGDKGADKESEKDSQKNEGKGDQTDSQNDKEDSSKENDDSVKVEGEGKSSKGDSDKSSSSNKSSKDDEKRKNEDKSSNYTSDGDIVEQQLSEIREEALEEAEKSLNKAKAEDDANEAKQKKEDEESKASSVSPEDLDSIAKNYKGDETPIFHQKKFSGDSIKLIPSEIERDAKKLEKEIKEIFINKKTFNSRHQRRGVLDKSSLWQIGTKDYNVFEKKGNPVVTDYAFYILKDGSGSMKEMVDSYSSKWFYACKASAIIEEAIKKYVPFKISTYTSSRRDNLHYVVKDFKENAKVNKCWNFYHHYKPSGGNKDGHSIRIATKELLKRTERNKVLIVLSDGEPSAYNSRDFGYADVREAVREARRLGIKVISIAFGSEAHRKNEIDTYKAMYQQGIVSCDTEQITSEIIKIFKREFSK